MAKSSQLNPSAKSFVSPVPRSAPGLYGTSSTRLGDDGLRGSVPTVTPLLGRYGLSMTEPSPSSLGPTHHWVAGRFAWHSPGRLDSPYRPVW